jgi:hypothetical protein
VPCASCRSLGEGFTGRRENWYNALMKMILRLILASILFTFSGPSLAAKVVFVSSDAPAKVTSDEKMKEPTLRDLKKSKEAQQDPAKKERLLKDLQQIYKQGRPEN